MSLEENIEVVKSGTLNFSKEKILKSALTAAYEAELPIALWRLPQSQEIHLVVAFDQARKIEKLDLEEAGSGFTFGPFNLETDSLFIREDFHCSFDQDEVHSSYNFGKAVKNEEEALFIAHFLKFLNDNTQDATKYHSAQNQINSNTPSAYLELVQKSVKAIKDGLFQKVVPAQKKDIELNESFDPVDMLLALCKRYENAFTSLVSVPEVGTWIGATPELLLQVEDSTIFRTVALAATQKRDEQKAPSETAWTQKEIEEQAMVSRYIINCFKKIRLREFEERGPKTVVAGNLLHLKTDYKVDMIETNFPQLGTVMLDLLHPTSAVAGMPKDEALAFLAEHEGLDREFFSGYLGPVNMAGSTDIFVNLRCMQISGRMARLYAGAGITEDSIPEKELAETHMKFNTLLNVIDQGV